MGIIKVGGSCGDCGTGWTLNKRTLEVKYDGFRNFIMAWEDENLIYWECPVCDYSDSEEKE